MLSFLFSPYGRVSRKAYWLNWLLPYFGISILGFALDAILFPLDPVTGDPQTVIQGPISLFFFWPSIALTTKRFHDRGRTGWWNLAGYMAILGLAGAGYFYYKTVLKSPDGIEHVLGPVVTINIILVVAASTAALLFVLVNTLFLRGQPGPNKYGPDPLGDPADVFE